VIDYIGDGGEAVHAAQFLVDAFVTEPVAHRGTLFDRLETISS
jgi:hypothetical protein